MPIGQRQILVCVGVGCILKYDKHINLMVGIFAIVLDFDAVQSESECPRRLWDVGEHPPIIRPIVILQNACSRPRVVGPCLWIPMCIICGILCNCRGVGYLVATACCCIPSTQCICCPCCFWQSANCGILGY